MPYCKHCGAPIDFQRTPSGKLMPVQARGVYAREDRKGRHLAFDAAGNCIRVSEAAKGDPDAIIVRFPHWAFCTGAEAARKPAAPAPPPKEEPRRAAKEPPQPQEIQLSLFEEDNGNGNYDRGKQRGQYWRL